MHIECTICGDNIEEYAPCSFSEVISDQLASSNFWYVFRTACEENNSLLCKAISDYEVIDYEFNGGGSYAAIIGLYLEEGYPISEEDINLVWEVMNNGFISWGADELSDMFGLYLSEDIDEEHNCEYLVPNIYVDGVAVREG